ncbi:MAG: glutathione S-transferase family protein [Aquabacterium sp.]
MQLVIGNKNYSSWSMRPWVLMRHFGIPFEEQRLSFAPWEAFRQRVRTLSPAGRVPLLIDGELRVWDTLAIAEYLAESFADRALWPRELRARARARSLCAEMHAGFSALRSHCPMNIEASLPEVGRRIWDEQPAVQADMQRIVTMWGEALADSGGPFLFGDFCVADAFYAPVCARIRGYGLPVSPEIADYIGRVWANDAVAAWVAEALAEHEWVPEDEPYRPAPV